jgi:hypothetical protein
MYKEDNDLQSRIAQFELDQKKNPVPSPKPKTKTPSSPPSSANPYLQARNKILADYSEWRRNEIAEMEKTGDINNRFYNDFVHEVAILGDSLS